MYPVVEDRGDRCRRGQTVDDAAKIGSHVALPVRGRRHVAPRAQRATVERVAQVHRLERESHFQELFQLRHAALVVLAAAWYGENDIVVVKAFRTAVSMESVRHDIAGTGSSFLPDSSGAFVTLPNPMFVLARSSL